MTVGKAIFTLLLSDTDLRAIVDNRIFPEVAQQDAVLPYVVYNISSNEPSDTKREPSKLDTAQIEVNLYSTSYSECIDMATHVRAALDRVRGTYSGVNVQSIQYLGEIIDFDEAQRTYNITADYDVRISRTDFEIAQGSPITGVTLGELSDVDTTGVTDGQVIAYDAAAQEWQPADDAGGVTELGQLDDVQFGQGGPESGDLLKYDGDEWTNDSLQKSEIGLGNVDNTSDVNKPVSTATQTELNAKANSADFSNVDNTSDADKPVSTATQTALNAKADTSAVPTDLNDLSDVSIVGAPAGNQALIYDTTAGAFQSRASYTNRFEDEVETGLYIPTIYAERGYSVKSEGDGTFIDASPDTPAAGKVIRRKIYHKTGFISDDDVIGDYTLIHTFADDTAYADTVAVFDAFEDGATYGVPPFTLFQTWEEVSATAYLLDETFGSGAEAAYSTRQLRFAQTDCMVIRRASGTPATTTIGFDSEGNIDEAAIETFCTGTTCTVYQWLDQSGNDNTATAPSGKEPTIYTGGELVKENGKVALDFDGANDALNSSLSVSLPLDNAMAIVAKGMATSTDEVFNIDGQNGLSVRIQYNNLLIAYTSSDQNYIASASNNQFLLYAGRQSSTNTVHGSLDGGAQFADTSKDSSIWNTATGILHVGARGGTSLQWDGQIQEVIYYDSDKLSNRTDIEENIGDYFTQNTPLLDTYSGAAAAYSLRLLDSTYTGSAVEVYNGSSYADIGFNVFGELDTVALAAHCGSSDGFVSKWYDQSGNSNTAAQTATADMPKIYDGTTGVVTDNGKPAFTSTGQTSLNFTQISDINSVFLVLRPTVFISNSLSFILGDSSNFDYHSGRTNQWLDNVYADPVVSNGDNYLNGTSVNLTTLNRSAGQYVLSMIHTANTVVASQISADRNIAGRSWIGNLQELIIYSDGKTDQRTDIETNINTFYDIF
ncbi:MAG: hypothetical protein CMJ25_11070 [Phycisphaerae bacterium]|nr:hypothetical protein [Phycisphaerae bacterium]